MDKAYQHAKENYRLEDWLRNSTFLVHYMREETGKLTTYDWGSLSRLCQRLKGLWSTHLKPCSADGSQAGSPLPKPTTALCLALCILSSTPLAESEADQKVTSTVHLPCEAAQQGGVVCYAGGGAGEGPDGDSAGHLAEQQGESTVGSSQPAHRGSATAGAAQGEERPLQLGESSADIEPHEAPLQSKPDQRTDLQPHAGAGVAVSGGNDAWDMAGSSSHAEQMSEGKRGVEAFEEEQEAPPAGAEQGLPSWEGAGRARLAVGRRRGRQRTQQRGTHRPNYRHLLRLWHT